MISESGQIKLIDYDISRIANRNAPSDTVALGTLGFAAPKRFALPNPTSGPIFTPWAY
jgi:serine/threonine protein kinase